ncbi:PKD domain-containing protein, partial [Candidatus Bipolaricaulota bacterium]|nr:PKD domain-containing protein [Candidatus Bipolaricaulota bacterium]
NAFDYGEQNYRVNTGGVGLTFSDLISLNGTGISASLTRGNFSVSLLDLYPEIENGGGRLSYENDSLYLAANLANLENDAGENAFTESVVGRFQQGETGEVEFEAGYTPEGGSYGQAYQAYGQVGFEPITLEGEAFFIGPEFAGSGSGDKGFRLSGSARGENYNQDLTYSYYYRTPGAVQTRSTMKVDRLAGNASVDILGASGSWPAGKEGRAFSLSGSFEMSSREDTREDPTLDESTQRFSGSVLYRYENIDFSISATEELRTNNLSGETFESFNISQEVGFSYEGFNVNAGFSNTLTENLTTGERTSSAGSFSLGIATAGSPYVSFSMTKNSRSLDFTLDSTVSPTEALEFSLSASTTIGQGDVSFGGSLNFTYECDLPLKFIITQGRVDGYVFVDSNENGEKDEDEEGIPELVLTIENTKIASGEDGYFKFPPLTPGTYELNIEDLPSKYGTKAELPQEVEVVKGEETTTYVPLTELSSISLSVFADANENGTRETGEGGIDAVGVILEGEGVERKRTTNQDGEINFRGLVPGTYSLVLNEDTLPPRSEITTGNADISVDLAGGETKEIEIGSFQRPREIIFGQPPEADFAYSPEAPTVGSEVNFSGGLSSDPDGNITKYEWDFQSDDQVDQTGKIVTHTFPEAGTYEVSLTVTDNDGNDVTVSKEIDVVSQG